MRDSLAQMVKDRVLTDKEEVFLRQDFADLGSGSTIDKALSRLVATSVLRRVGRGLYDVPRKSAVLDRLAPPNIDAVVEAICRRDRIKVMPDGITAANRLGLTNAVPAKTVYLTDGPTKIIKIGGRTIQFQHADARLMSWHDSIAQPWVLALHWLGPTASPDVLQRASDAVKQELTEGSDLLPDWMADLLRSAE